MASIHPYMVWPHEMRTQRPRQKLAWLPFHAPHHVTTAPHPPMLLAVFHPLGLLFLPHTLSDKQTNNHNTRSPISQHANRLTITTSLQTPSPRLPSLLHPTYQNVPREIGLAVRPFTATKSGSLRSLLLSLSSPCISCHPWPMTWWTCEARAKEGHWSKTSLSNECILACSRC